MTCHSIAQSLTHSFLYSVNESLTQVLCPTVTLHFSISQWVTLVLSHWVTELACRSIAHSLIYPLLYSVNGSLTLLLRHWIDLADICSLLFSQWVTSTQSLNHWIDLSVSSSLNHSLTQSLFHACVHKLIHSFKFKILEFRLLSFCYWPQSQLRRIFCGLHGDNDCDRLGSLLKIKQKSCHPKCYSVQKNVITFRRIPTAWPSGTRLSSPFRLHLEPCEVCFFLFFSSTFFWSSACHSRRWQRSYVYMAKLDGADL
jgi:hypothetical protein